VSVWHQHSSIRVSPVPLVTALPSYDEMLSSKANVIIWDKMLSSGMKFYHLELLVSSGANVIIWGEVLSSGMMKCYELMLSSGMKCHPLELMLSSGTNFII
jgi:hypothetical protein